MMELKYTAISIYLLLQTGNISGYLAELYSAEILIMNMVFAGLTTSLLYLTYTLSDH